MLVMLSYCAGVGYNIRRGTKFRGSS